MKITKFIPLLFVIFIGNATATTVLELSGDDVLRKTSELRLTLNLTATQAIPWLQAEARTREILREQNGRRERFQIELREQIGRAQFSVEKLAATIDSEDAQALEERRMIRQVWISVLKGLNETQERQIRESLLVILDTPSIAPPSPQSQSNFSTEEPPRQRSGRGGRGGLGSGMGGGFGEAKF